MSQKVVLDEGGAVSVHTRIKDICKSVRSSRGLTNQDICKMITERYGVEEISVATVNNFFSDRTKATTVYTTGYICGVLGVSLDAIFGIDNESLPSQEQEFVRQLAQMKVDVRYKDQQISRLEQSLREKEDRLNKSDNAAEHYRKQAEASIGRVPRWVFIVTLVLLVCALLFIGAYLVYFDVGNPDYGIFTYGAAAANDMSSLIKTAIG